MRRDVVMVAHGVPEVEDDSTGGENHSCSRSRSPTTRLAADGPARTR